MKLCISREYLRGKCFVNCLTEKMIEMQLCLRICNAIRRGDAEAKEMRGQTTARNTIRLLVVVSSSAE